MVDIISPEAVPAGKPLDVRARVTMTCGCPTEPSGLWDADGIEVTARAMQGDKVVGNTTLRYAGEISTFAGTIPSLPNGTYRLEVTAAQILSANFGVSTQTITMKRKH